MARKPSTNPPKQAVLQASSGGRTPTDTDLADAAARIRERDRDRKRKKYATEEGRKANQVAAAAGMAKIRAATRDVRIPAVVNPGRRESCRLDPMLFGKTYFPHYMTLRPAKYHQEMFDDLRRSILYGLSAARAAPRGGAKDTIFAICMIWAMVYGHRHWLVYAGATLALSKKKLENIKFEFEENELLLEDFPEACVPVRALERSPQRARQQKILTEDGKESYFSRIEWTTDEIVLARVEGAPCSGAIVTSATVEGANRGMVRGPLRPDQLCINDGETDEAARSETQRKKIEETIDQSLSGLAGPGRSIAKFFLCTIVCPGCMSEKYTDPIQKPSWHGKRYKMVEQFPENVEMWEHYMELYREGEMSGEDPHARKAHQYYLDNREQMDKGAIVSWEDRYIRELLEDGSPREVSAIQHAYNLRIQNGEKAFWSEYQNEPLPEHDSSVSINPRLVASRVGGYSEGIIPAGAIAVTRGIDVGARELHSVVTAWMPNGDSYIADYSRIPVDAPEGDLSKPGTAIRKALEIAVTSALQLAKSEADDLKLKDSNGVERDIDMTLVDSGFLERVVYNFCRQAGPRYRPTKGFGSLQGQKRYAEPQKKEKSRRPLYHCFASKTSKGWLLYHVNADFWKLFAHLRFLQDPDTPGATSLWGMEPSKHRTFANHICAERFDAELRKWVKEAQHNHFLDAFALSCCAGGMLGIRIEALAAAPIRDESTKPQAPQVTPVLDSAAQGKGTKMKLPAPTVARGGARIVRRPPSKAW